jgi:hypothetical protein
MINNFFCDGVLQSRMGLVRLVSVALASLEEVKADFFHYLKIIYPAAVAVLVCLLIATFHHRLFLLFLCLTSSRMVRFQIVLYRPTT